MIIGIDLGTTNSCVAVLDEEGAPRVLAPAGGNRTLPSVVAYTGDGVLVGEPARRQMVTNATNTVLGAKRLIGRKVNAPEVGALAKSVAYRIVAAKNGDAWVRVGDTPTSPQEISSHVLREIRRIAEEALGEPVTRAVITVPAYFDDSQRQATRDAGTIAGLEVTRILNEPTAAALAYGAHRVKRGRRIIAVFDLGGGTFDISLMSVESDVFEVLATNGDSHLGGDDWDRTILARLADEIFDEHRTDVTADAVATSRLREAAEAAKRALSSERSASIDLPYLFQDRSGSAIHYQRRMTRDELRDWTKPLLERLSAPCELALKDAGLTTDDIEEVLLVGGMSRVPAVQDIVETIFGKAPSKGANPDEVVALGAAAHAGIIGGALGDTTLLDVAAHTVGIRVGEDDFAAIIPRNSMLPVRDNKLFSTTRDDQEFVEVEIYQGESNKIRENRRLGRVRLEDLPKGPAGSVKIELSITIDVESILRVTATERSTGKQAKVVIHPSGGLSAADLDEIVERQRKG